MNIRGLRICNVAGACVVGGATSGSVTTSRAAPPLIPTKVNQTVTTSANTSSTTATSTNLSKSPRTIQSGTTQAYSFITKWGSQGSGDGQFSLPSGRIAVDSSGSVYVTDWGNNRVQKLNSDGSFITKWGSHGKGDGEFNNPEGIAVDSSGNVYVADAGRPYRIQKFR